MKKMLGYINSDHAALTWDQANDLVISGKAGMTIMGDWVDADYKQPRYANGYAQMAWIFYVQRDYPKAQPLFEKAVKAVESNQR